MVVQMAGWWRQVWQLWRRWRFYFKYFTTATTTPTTTTTTSDTPTPSTLLLVVVVVVMVGGNVLLILPPSTPSKQPLDMSYDWEVSDTTTTTTTAATTTARSTNVRPLIMDWKRRWIRPWPAKKRQEEDERKRRRGKGRGGGVEGEGRGGRREWEEERRQDEEEYQKNDEEEEWEENNNNNNNNNNHHHHHNNNNNNKETEIKNIRIFEKLNKQREEDKEADESHAHSRHNHNHNNNHTTTTLSCHDYRIGFTAEGSLPAVALASYPGSGNTWLRELLEGASGVFTGSTYDDQHLYVTGLVGELEAWSAGTTLTQKTHSASPSVAASFKGRALLLVRNPYHAILAYHNYLFGGHLGFAPVANYRSKDWGAFVHMQARAWIDMALNWTRPIQSRGERGRGRGKEKEERQREVKDWIKENVQEGDGESEVKKEGKERRLKEWMLMKKMEMMQKEEERKRRKDEEKEEQGQLKEQMEMQKTIQEEEEEEEEEEVGRRVAVVHYEELVQDPITPLLPVLAALPIPHPSPHRLACLKRHQHSRRRFKRMQEYLPEGLEVFSPVDRDKIDRAIRYVDHHLRRRHLPPLPLHLYDYYNNTQPRTQKTVRVPCFEGETRVECDARVDELNAAWRRRKRSRRGESEGNPSSLSREGRGDAKEEEEAEEEEEEEETGPLERFAGTKVGLFLTRGFTSLMNHLRGDPLLQKVARTP